MRHANARHWLLALFAVSAASPARAGAADSEAVDLGQGGVDAPDSSLRA
jgi:hypothetical protein